MTRSMSLERRLRSPMFCAGYADGQADRAALCEDPDAQIQGPMPPDPAYPAMYNYGYEAGFQGVD